MKKEGRNVQRGQAAAHIVASGGSQNQWGLADDSRNLLNKYTINVNDAANGVPLGHPNPHSTTHTRIFHETVNQRLHNVENRMLQNGYGWRAIRSALRRELRKIGKEL